jgi:putative ABC transport system ATP-binding protein
MAALIEVADVSKRYGAGAAAFQALTGVSFALAAGEFVSIIGLSGSGKSTLLNLIAALDVPTGGRVLFKGRDLRGFSDDEASRLRLDEMGFVFQAFHLFPALTAEENVAWPLEFAGVRRSRIRAAVDAALRRVGMADRADRRPAELSGGEQQRVAIARALVNEPSVLLADEPTGNLDSKTGEAIVALIGELHRERGMTVVMVTHRTDAATRGRVIELHDGRIRRDSAELPWATAAP